MEFTMTMPEIRVTKSAYIMVTRISMCEVRYTQLHTEFQDPKLAYRPKNRYQNHKNVTCVGESGWSDVVGK